MHDYNNQGCSSQAVVASPPAGVSRCPDSELLGGKEHFGFLLYQPGAPRMFTAYFLNEDL